MREKHTPGPWRVEIVGAGGGYDNPTDVCEILSERERICEYVSEANARLIAAAPEMFAALCRVRDLSPHAAADEERAVWQAMHDAINLALLGRP